MLKLSDHLRDYLNNQSNLIYLGTTVIDHNLLADTVIPKCEGSDCFIQYLNYPVDVNQLKALTDISSECYQDIKV